MAKKSNRLVKDLASLWIYLGRRRLIQFSMLFFLMIIAVLAEMISIGSVIPFLTALTSPEVFSESSWLQPIISFLAVKSADDLLFLLTTGFIIAATFSAIIRIVLLWANTRLAMSMGVQLRSDLYTKLLYQSYEYHLAHNSSEQISMATQQVSAAIHAGVMHVLMLMSSVVLSVAIIITILVIHPMAAAMTFLVLGGGYTIIGSLVRKHIYKNSLVVAECQPKTVKTMQEGIGGIRDLIMDNSQEVFSRAYSKIVFQLQHAAMVNGFLSNLPKPMLELLAITMIALLAYSLQTQSVSNATSALPLLGALALGAQRLLPTLQQVYLSWSTIKGTQGIIEDIVKQLSILSINHNYETDVKLNFERSIKLKNVSFNYDGGSKEILKGIDLTIIKGSRIGLIGETGSGKSTLIDIVMALLAPKKGELIVDDQKINNKNIRAWQQNIAHVPQSIYLSDTSIAENIAFGVPEKEINYSRVKDAAERAQLRKYITQLPEGYQTIIGERGVRLSGGQRQRIGIARALYKQAEVIVFDEATSALDAKTEKGVSEAIDSLSKNLTIIIIAHRITTLERCDIIYRLDNGVISHTYKSHKELVN